jgi:lipopolysaccharide transport system ATP-binding protein
LENGSVKFEGNINDTIENYLSDQIIQSSFDGIDGDEKILYMKQATVRPLTGDTFYNSLPIEIQFKVRVVKNIGSLVIGFNLYSAFQYPLARADYNDIDGRTSLEPGEYVLTFVIPPYTLSNGDYKIMFDVAERNVKCYTTEKSQLSFSVVQGKDNFGNTFAENIPIKSSLFREKWLSRIERSE